MQLLVLLTLPLIGVFIISTDLSNKLFQANTTENSPVNQTTKKIALAISILNFILCVYIFLSWDFSFNQFQFVTGGALPLSVNDYPFFVGVDGLSIYFVFLTTFIMPIAILSNWNSITEDLKSYTIIMLLLETLLIAVFLVLDIFLFYIFFESILPPLFILIGMFGSSNRVRASFYLFLYTLFGSLFLLLSILVIYSVMGVTDYDALYKINWEYLTQFFLFCGIFLAFAVKTPVIFLNTWLLKAHVESPLGGSILLAAIVLKLSLYGVLRIILPIFSSAALDLTFIVYMICVLTILYASFSTLRTSDMKEIIAYSSVSHAAVYVLGVFSNTIQGIEGGILLGLAHGFVSSGLFICAGGILYDRASTRLIYIFRGVAQGLPLFSIFFFVLCLGNAGTPLTLNFVGEFLSLYGSFERMPLMATFASSSIVFSAAYTIYLFNRIAFAGKFSKFFDINVPDINRREFVLLFLLAIPTILLGIYPCIILDGLHFVASALIYSTDMNFGDEEKFIKFGLLLEIVRHFFSIIDLFWNDLLFIIGLASVPFFFLNKICMCIFEYGVYILPNLLPWWVLKYILVAGIYSFSMPNLLPWLVLVLLLLLYASLARVVYHWFFLRTHREYLVSSTYDMNKIVEAANVTLKRYLQIYTALISILGRTDFKIDKIRELDNKFGTIKRYLLISIVLTSILLIMLLSLMWIDCSSPKQIWPEIFPEELVEIYKVLWKSILIMTLLLIWDFELYTPRVFFLFCLELAITQSLIKYFYTKTEMVYEIMQCWNKFSELCALLAHDITNWIFIVGQIFSGNLDPWEGFKIYIEELLTSFPEFYGTILLICVLFSYLVLFIVFIYLLKKLIISLYNK